jgi:DNA polymerase
MRTVRLRDPIDFEGWRTAARELAAEGVPPEDVVWQVEGEAEQLFSFPLDGGRWPGGPDGGGEREAFERNPAEEAYEATAAHRARFDQPERERHAPGAQGRAVGLRRKPTYNERRLWEALRKLELNFRRQAPIGRFVVDFVQHASKLVVEIDGYYHQFEDRQTRDAERDAWLRTQGYRVLRVPDDDVTRDIDAVVARIREQLGGAGVEPPPPPASPPPSDPAPPGHLPPSRGKDIHPSSPTIYGRADGAAAATHAFTVPRAFIDLAQYVVCHRDPERWALLYRLLHRLRAERGLLSVAVDPDIARAKAMSKAVRRDIHKMRAYVRFREIHDEQGPLHVAWFEPEHHIVEINAPFFVRRFNTMRWTVITPERSALWDGETLTFAPGGAKADAPTEDAMEEVWRGYYRSIFNPARLKVKAMQGHMPQKYWRNLPEAELIAPLIKDASRRTETMVAEAPSDPAPRRMRAAPRARRRGPPLRRPDRRLRPQRPRRAPRQAMGCRACPLWEPATQTVFGEGPRPPRSSSSANSPATRRTSRAPLRRPRRPDVQPRPGRGGRGPHGGLRHQQRQALQVRAPGQVPPAPEAHGRGDQDLQPLAPAGDRDHRARAGRGARRHRRPGAVRKAVTIGRVRGVLQPLPGAVNDNQQVLVTVHPSFLLRIPEADRKAEEYAKFVEDLRLVAPRLA